MSIYQGQIWKTTIKNLEYVCVLSEPCRDLDGEFKKYNGACLVLPICFSEKSFSGYRFKNFLILTGLELSISEKKLSECIDELSEKEVDKLLQVYFFINGMEYNPEFLKKIWREGAADCCEPELYMGDIFDSLEEDDLF